jgi:hypothetical protein
MVGVLGRGGGLTTVGLCTISLGSAKGLEEGHGHETSGVRKSWIACFVPVLIVFSADNVEKVTSRKAEFLAGTGLVIVKGSNNLEIGLGISIGAPGLM